MNAVAAARRRAPARGGSVVAVGLLAVLLLGVALGVVWWWLAPLARADVVDGQVYLSGHQELQVGQDGWFSVVNGAAGVLGACVLAARRLGHDRRLLVLGPPAALVVSLVAWATGALLGPSSLLDQLHGGATHPLTPLALHAHGALLVGPLLFAVTRALSALFTRPAPPGELADADPPGASGTAPAAAPPRAPPLPGSRERSGP